MDKFLKADLISNYTGGKNTVEEADELDITEARQCLNVNLKRQRGVQPREGATVLGTYSTTANPVKSSETMQHPYGGERPIRSSGTVTEALNEFLATPDYVTLETGFTTGQVFGFANGDKHLYMCNGVEIIRKWTGATAIVDGDNLADTILTFQEVTDNRGTVLDSAAKLGFTSTGGTVIFADGTTKTYSGISGLTLTGLTGLTALSLADGASVVEVPISSGFTSAPIGNILLVKDARLMVSGVKTTPTILYGSKIGDATNFGFSSPAVADDGFALNFWGHIISSLADRATNLDVMSENGSQKLSFTKLTSSSDTVLTVPAIDGHTFKGYALGAISQKSTLGLNFDTIFTSKEIGLRRLSRAVADEVDKPESLTGNIEDDFKDYELDDPAIGTINQQIHLALKSSDKLGGNNTMILKDMRSGFIGTFEGLNASSFFNYDNKLYYGDSYTKNCWEMYNGEYSDYNGTDYFDYIFRWRSKMFNYGVPEHFKELGYVWIEGYILPSTTATFTAYLETDDGITEVLLATIKGTDAYVRKTSSSAFGLTKFGESGLAAGKEPDLPSGARKFYRIITQSKLDLLRTKWLKLQFELETYEAGSFIRLTKIRPLVFVHPIDKTKHNNLLNNTT